MPHSDPDVVVPSFNGESIGHWEGDTLVVDTKYFPGHHHWMDQGGASIPASDQLHIVERMQLIENGETLADRVHDDGSEELEGRLGDDEALQSPARHRHRRGRVHAGS